MRWIRIVAFAIIYFSIYVISAVFKTIESLVGSPELTWYLENPSATLFKTSVKILFVELPRNFLLMPMLLTLVVNSFLLGFVTDWALYILERHIALRKRNFEEDIRCTHQNEQLTIEERK